MRINRLNSTVFIFLIFVGFFCLQVNQISANTEYLVTGNFSKSALNSSANDLLIDSVVGYNWSGAGCWTRSTLKTYTYENELITSSTEFSNGVRTNSKIYQYNGSGQLIRLIDSTFLEFTYDYFYDESGRLNRTHISNFDSYSGKVRKIVDSVIFNENNQKIYRETRRYFNDTISSEPFEFTKWQYNSNNNLTEEISGFINNPLTTKDTLKSSRETFTYSDDEVYECIWYSWNIDSLKWLNQTKLTNEYDENMNLVKETNYNWVHLEWAPQNYYDYEFDDYANVTVKDYYVWYSYESEPSKLNRYIINSNTDKTFTETTGFKWSFYSWIKQTKLLEYYQTGLQQNEWTDLCESDAHNIWFKRMCPQGTTIDPLFEGPYHLSVYPNPASENLTIDFDHKLSDNVKVTVITLEGKMVQEKEFPVVSPEGKIELPLSNIPDGIYFIRIHSNGYVYNGKFIVNKY